MTVNIQVFQWYAPQFTAPSFQLDELVLLMKTSFSSRRGGPWLRRDSCPNGLLPSGKKRTPPMSRPMARPAHSFTAGPYSYEI